MNLRLLRSREPLQISEIENGNKTTLNVDQGLALLHLYRNQREAFADIFFGCSWARPSYASVMRGVDDLISTFKYSAV